MAKTNKGLVEYAKAQLGKPYWYGTFGQSASKNLHTQKKRQYPNYYKWNYAGETAKVHDCVGLIKGYLWCGSANGTTPAYNAAQDKSANGMRDACTTKGVIATIPEVPGVLVFMNNHVGVYIGNGEVIEARGHAYGVVKTKLKSRAWTSWGYCPYITYEEADAKPEDDGVVSDIAPAGFTDAAQHCDTAKIGAYKVKQCSGLHLRTGASTECESLVVLPAGTPVICTGYYTGDWFRVETADSRVGFCHSDYLIKQGG